MKEADFSAQEESYKAAIGAAGGVSSDKVQVRSVTELSLTESEITAGTGRRRAIKLPIVKSKAAYAAVRQESKCQPREAPAHNNFVEVVTEVTTTPGEVNKVWSKLTEYKVNGVFLCLLFQ